MFISLLFILFATENRKTSFLLNLYWNNSLMYWDSKDSDSELEHPDT